MQTFKRCADFFFASLLLVILLPLLAVIAAAVWLQFGRPILFKQTRPGLHGKPFLLYKFRTMHNLTDKNGLPLDDADRLTRFGRFLRAASLDELPELWNVTRGEMSLVGPRPLLTEYMSLYNQEQHRRHDVRPGISGWAQVNGRNAISWEEKFRHDLWYIDHWNLLLDLKILWLTLARVVKKQNIAQSGHVTMEKFQGSPET